MVPCISSTLSSNLTFGPNLRTSAAWMPSRSRSRRSERSSCFAVVSSRNAANISVDPAMRLTPVSREVSLATSRVGLHRPPRWSRLTRQPEDGDVSRALLSELRQLRDQPRVPIPSSASVTSAPSNGLTSTCSSSGTATISTSRRPPRASRPDPGAPAEEAAPVRGPAQRPLDAGRGHLQHVPRTDHRARFQETLEGPADPRAVVGRDALAGSAVRAVHPYLQDGALQRPDAAQIDELEAEAGDVVANRCEQRVDRHRGCGKKMWGNSPTSHSWPDQAPPGQQPNITAAAGMESIRWRGSPR